MYRCELKIDMYNSIKNEASQLTYEEDGPSNIVFHGKKNTIKGATVEKLLEKLTEEEQGKIYFYRNFTEISQQTWILYLPFFLLIVPLLHLVYCYIAVYRDFAVHL